MMTTQRLARASRSRFFIGLAVLILTVGFVAIFHSTQQELQQLHQLEERCEQQQQALAQQLSAGELSARAERLEHQQTKIDLLRRTGEAKEFRDKTLMESNLKFGALQQSYKLLKSQNDDLVDECGKLRRTHLEQLGAVETKLKNIAAQQAQFERQRAREAEDAKVGGGDVLFKCYPLMRSFTPGRSKCASWRSGSCSCCNSSSQRCKAQTSCSVCSASWTPTSRTASGVRPHRRTPFHCRCCTSPHWTPAWPPSVLRLSITISTPNIQ